jgi:hypothetical protein
MGQIPETGFAGASHSCFYDRGAFSADGSPCRLSVNPVVLISNSCLPYEAFSIFAPLINTPSVDKRAAPTLNFEYGLYEPSLAM